MPHHKWSEVREGFLATLTPEERAEREARRQAFVAAYRQLQEAHAPYKPVTPRPYEYPLSES